MSALGNKRDDEFKKPLGRALVLLGLLMNEWTLEAITPGIAASAGTRLVVWLADWLSIIGGLWWAGLRPTARENVFGYLLVVAGMLFNEWVLRFLGAMPIVAVWDVPYQGGGTIEEAGLIVVRFLSLALTLVGVLLLHFKPHPAKLIALAISLLIFVGAFEGVLRTGVLDQLGNADPTWIPRRYKEADEALNRRFQNEAAANPFGFRDRVRLPTKPEDGLRIAVLGDSFVWGHGLEWESIWTHRLENKVTEYASNTEVLSWGLPGWSTLNEFEFLRSHGVDFDIDFAIFAFVSNDFHLGDTKLKYLVWDADLPRVLHILIPETIEFVSAHLDGLIERWLMAGYGYDAWLARMHAPENLSRYEQLLDGIARYCRSQDIELMFVLTPHRVDSYHRDIHGKMMGLLDRVGIEALDLVPPMDEQYGHLNPRELWANPANAHPNEIGTELFAEEVFQYLKARGILDPAGTDEPE